MVDGRQHMKKSRSLNLNNNMHLNNGLDSSETEHTNENLTSEQIWNSKYVLEAHFVLLNSQRLFSGKIR